MRGFPKSSSLFTQSSADPVMQAAWREVSSDNIMYMEAAIAKLKREKNFVFMINPFYYASNHKVSHSIWNFEGCK